MTTTKLPNFDPGEYEPWDHSQPTHRFVRDHPEHPAVRRLVPVGGTYTIAEDP